MKILNKKILFFGFSTLIVAVIVSINVNYASELNNVTNYSLKNLEALASNTPGEEKPSQNGTWSSVANSRTFICKRVIAGKCYNIYTESFVFACGDGTDSAVCGTNRSSEDKVPCDC